MIGVQRGIDVHVFDQVKTGTKPDLVAALGATYHTGRIEHSCPHPDIVIECTGVASLVFDAMEHLNAGGVACLTGVSGGKHALRIDASMLNRSMVLENQAVVGSVNANHRHYEAAAAALVKADPAWISRLVTRRVPLDHWQDALARKPDDVKVVIEVAS